MIGKPKYPPPLVKLAKLLSTLSNRNVKPKNERVMSNPEPKVVHFCSYKNRETKGWQKSREYDSIKALMTAMMPYMENHPNTTVQYLTRTVYV